MVQTSKNNAKGAALTVVAALALALPATALAVDATDGSSETVIDASELDPGSDAPIIDTGTDGGSEPVIEDPLPEIYVYPAPEDGTDIADSKDPSVDGPQTGGEDPIPVDLVVDEPLPEVSVDPVPVDVAVDEPLPEDVPIEWVIRGSEPDVMYMAFGMAGDMDDAATRAAEVAAENALDHLNSEPTPPSKAP